MKVKSLSQNSVMLLLILATIACNATPPSTSSVSASSSITVSHTAKALLTTPSSCPSQNFERFLTVFANDIEVQKVFVALPLESESVDTTAEPEPKPVTKKLGLSELHFPLMPSLQRQAMDGVKLSQRLTNAKEAEVTLVKEDTDYQRLFYFKNDGCWKLYRMRDDSL